MRPGAAASIRSMRGQEEVAGPIPGPDYALEPFLARVTDGTSLHAGSFHYHVSPAMRLEPVRQREQSSRRDLGLAHLSMRRFGHAVHTGNEGSSSTSSPVWGMQDYYEIPSA